MTRVLRVVGGSIVLALCIVLLGCGGASSKRAVVSGTVKYDGKPVEEGRITFMPASADVKSGGNAQGDIKDGQYRVLDVVPGKNFVLVESTKSTTRPASYQQAQKDREAMMAEAMRNQGKMNDPEYQKKIMETGNVAGSSIPKDALGNNQQVDIPPEGRTLDLLIDPRAPKK
ncbi:MAG TPA: hypothetical protein VGY58_01820 [Gemmataceae bacterium]|jgi:hypothetical protein|nr:hypothetical protein [Gemmataceae bacterium]